MALLSSTSVVGPKPAGVRDPSVRVESARVGVSDTKREDLFTADEQALGRREARTHSQSHETDVTHATRETDDNTPPNLSGQILAAD